MPRIDRHHVGHGFHTVSENVMEQNTPSHPRPKNSKVVMRALHNSVGIQSSGGLSLWHLQQSRFGFFTGFKEVLEDLHIQRRGG